MRMSIVQTLLEHAHCREVINLSVHLFSAVIIGYKFSHSWFQSRLRIARWMLQPLHHFLESFVSKCCRSSLVVWWIVSKFNRSCFVLRNCFYSHQTQSYCVILVESKYIIIYFFSTNHIHIFLCEKIWELNLQSFQITNRFSGTNTQSSTAITSNNSRSTTGRSKYQSHLAVEIYGNIISVIWKRTIYQNCYLFRRA